MQCAYPIDLDAVCPNAAFAAHSSRRRQVRRVLRSMHDAFTPSVVVLAGLLAFGCYALLTLTGSGPQSWEARLCANEGLNLRSCQAATPMAPPASAVVGLLR